MKLFQQMLVATASLGLIAPIAAQASDVINLEGMNDYNRSKKSSSKRFDSNTFVNEVNEELATLKGRVDGLEAQQNNFEAGSFSETTTMDGKAVFTVGSLDTDDDAFTGKVLAEYMYQMNLNTSFNGDDNLYIRLKAGNGDSWTDKKNIYNGYISAGKGNTDYVKVDKIWYTRPINERNTIAKLFNAKFPTILAQPGGETGIDIYPKGFDKSQIIKDFSDSDNLYFFGDRMDVDGNDFTLAEAIKLKHGITYQVNDWIDTWNHLKEII